MQRPKTTRYSQITQCIGKFANNLKKIISVAHESALPLLRTKVIPNIITVMSVLSDCPDMNVRGALSEVLCHLLLVAVGSAKIEIQEYDERIINENLKDLTDEEVIKYVLKRLSTLFKVDKKDSHYKKLRGFFKIWDTLISSSMPIMEWLIRTNKFIDRAYSSLASRSILHGEEAHSLRSQERL